MSHTFVGPDGTRFCYNSDLSHVSIVDTNADGAESLYNVNGADLLAFVSETVRQLRIGALEQMDTLRVLGIPSETRRHLVSVERSEATTGPDLTGPGRKS